MKHQIFGLTGEIIPEGVYIYEISLNRDDLDYNLLNYYIRKGDYDSLIPIAIEKNKDQYYLISSLEIKEENEKKVKIYHYIGIISKIYKEKMDLTEDVLSTLISSVIDFVFFNNGFKKPNQVRSFLGKQSKGKITKKNSEREPITFKESIYNEKVLINDSINKDIAIKSNIFQIFVLPNFEFELDDKEIAASTRIIDKILELDKVKEIIFYKPQKMAEDSLNYLDLVQKNLKNSSLFKNIKLIPIFENNLLSRNFEISSPYDNSFSIIELNNSDLSFKKNIFDFFVSKYNSLEKINITLFLDSIRDVPEIVNDYVKKLQSNSLFSIKSSHKFTKISEIKQDESLSPVYVIVNNEIPGHKMIHQHIKNITRQSKMINFDTISRIENIEEHFIIMWLSLMSRKYHKFPYIIKNYDFPYDKIISIMIYRDALIPRYIVAKTSINTQDFSYSSDYYNFLINTNKIIEREKIIDKIIENLSKDIIDDKRSILLLEKNDPYSESVFNLFENIIDVVVLGNYKCRILKKRQNLYEKPVDGLFFQLITENEYILITTGTPDEPDNGLPNSLYVKMSKNINDKKEVMEFLYKLTFLQTKMLGKNFLPSILNINKKFLFKSD